MKELIISFKFHERSLKRNTTRAWITERDERFLDEIF